MSLPMELEEPIRDRMLACGCRLYSQVHILSDGTNLSWARVDPECGGNHRDEMLKEHP